MVPRSLRLQADIIITPVRVPYTTFPATVYCRGSIHIGGEIGRLLVIWRSLTRVFEWPSAAIRFCFIVNANARTRIIYIYNSQEDEIL